jgi:putative glycosyltransferase (TIGR04372 family)
MSLQARISSVESWVRRNRPARLVALTLLVAILFLPSLALYAARFRLLRLNALGRIGHLAAEPDTFIKEGQLGLRAWYYGVILSPPGAAANDCLVDYWSRHVKVVRSPVWAWIWARFNPFPYLQYDLSRYTLSINQTAPSIAIQRAWGDRPALLALDRDHQREGRARLAQLGLRPDAEFVCFHCREEGYSPVDEALHSFRNCTVENYLPAVTELARRGVWCIRMGDPSMRRLKPMEGVIDYAHLEIRSAWMDVFLCASCKFFLGSASGLSEVSTVFGRSCGMANQAPPSAVLKFGPNDVAIPKLLWSELSERYLDFPAIFDADVANFRFTNLFCEHRILVVENTPEDVRDLALEMLERSQGRAFYTQADDERQQRFRALMKPGHYSYGGVNRVGREFLRKYEYLLGNRQKR